MLVGFNGVESTMGSGFCIEGKEWHVVSRGSGPCSRKRVYVGRVHLLHTDIPVDKRWDVVYYEVETDGGFADPL